MPYDARIEYLESTGTQCIDTGYIPNENSTVIIDAQFNNNRNDAALFSAYAGWTWGMWTLFCSRAQIYWALANTFYDPYPTPIRQEYKIIGAFLYINDMPFRETQPAFSSNMVNSSLHLFSRGNMVGEKSTGRLFGVKIHDNSISADLIPVRVGTTGYMYDKISGQLLGNAGTGEFILGPDID